MRQFNNTRGVEENKKRLTTNIYVSWAVFLLCICAYAPLPFDFIPLFGPPAYVAGTVLLLIFLYLIFPYRFGIYTALAVAFAKTQQGKMTVTDLISEFSISQSRAQAICRRLRKAGLVRMVREAANTDDEVEYFYLIN